MGWSVSTLLQLSTTVIIADAFFQSSLLPKLKHHVTYGDFRFSRDRVDGGYGYFDGQPCSSSIGMKTKTKTELSMGTSNQYLEQCITAANDSSFIPFPGSENIKVSMPVIDRDRDRDKMDRDASGTQKRKRTYFSSMHAGTGTLTLTLNLTLTLTLTLTPTLILKGAESWKWMKERRG